MRVAGVRLRGAAVAYVVVEDAFILAALLGALAFAHFGLSWLLDTPLALLHVALLIVAIKGAFFCAGLYDFSRMTTRSAFWRRNLIGIATVAAGAWLIWALPTGERVACGAFLLAFAPVVLLGRLLYEVLAGSHGFRRRLLFLGIGMQARRTAREILDMRSRDYDLLGFLAEKPEEMGWRIGRRSVLGLYRDLERVVEQERVDAVVVALDDRRRQLPLGALLRIRLAGVEVLEEARVHEEIAGKIPVEDLRPSWLIFSEGFSNSGLRISTKRAFDVTISALGLLLTVPLGLLAALLIKLESKGPILFRQVRVGKGGKEFVLLKFRSMREDAEREGRPVWAAKDDPRVTRVGRILRKTRIDEIPQMLSVLKGEMSFVGPRPERPYFVEQLRETIPFYDQRHAVKPGITGWAQVRFRYGSDETDAVEKLRHDMFYIKHHSILFDLRILLETVRVVFRRDMGR